MVDKKTTTLVFAVGAVMVLGTLAPQLLVMVQTAEAHGVPVSYTHLRAHET